MHINKTMIIKVATDATVAIIITTYLSSSGRFRLNGLSEPLLVAIVENREPLFVAVVEDRELSLIAITVVTDVVVVLVVALGVILTDVLGVCVVDANRVIGS